MDLERINELKSSLRDIDSKIAKKQSYFLDDASLTKMKQQRKFLVQQIEELTSEA